MNRSLMRNSGLLRLSQGLALSLIALGTTRCSSSSGDTNPGTETSGNPASSGTGGTGSASGGSSGESSGATSGGSSGAASGASSGGSSGAASGASSGGSSGAASGDSSDAGDMDVALMAVPDGGCTSITQGYVATLVTIPVSWPATKSGTTTVTTAGTGNVEIVLLSNELTGTDAGTLMYTGTSRTCATTLPPVAFNTAINALLKIPTGDTGYLEISLPDSLWDKITRTTAISGTITGWNPGSTVTTPTSTGVFGLAPTSTYANPMTPWPATCTTNCTPNGSFMASDLQDDDHDGNPGVTALGVKMTSGKNYYILPPLSAAGGDSADEIFIALRTAFSVTSMRLDCVTGSGTADVTVMDNHVVGCHDVTSNAACDSAQVSFLDTNRVVYKLTGGATVKTKQITTPAVPSCADARTAVGFTG